MKKSSKTSPRILISGGGTGGHIYPAIAIADEIKRRLPDAAILFIGADGRMEMEKVPKIGYTIKGLPIVGFDRGNLLANVNFPIKLMKSLLLAKKIRKEFQPDIAVGTGGYASGPMLWEVGKHKIPYVLQEQNSYPGVTNKLLMRKASAICTAYEEIPQFPKEKTHYTGNPIRVDMFQNLPDREESIRKFHLDPTKPTVLSVGGSQGSRAINNAWLANINQLAQSGVQLIWQTGKLDYNSIKEKLGDGYPMIHLAEFIYDMQDAYAAADTIVSRAGAMAISELEMVGKSVVLIPLPTAAEDHQTKNAQALVEADAALMLSDEQAKTRLVTEVLLLANDKEKQKRLGENINKLAKPNATKEIVDIVLGLI